MLYYVYMLLCEGDTFYTGYTKNPESRMELHKRGKGAKYTHLHRPKRLVYIEGHDSQSEAMRRERQIKKLTHCQKLKLVNSSASKTTKNYMNLF